MRTQHTEKTHQKTLYDRIIPSHPSITFEWEKVEHNDAETEVNARNSLSQRRQGKLATIRPQWLTYLKSASFAKNLAKRRPDVAETYELENRMIAHKLPNISLTVTQHDICLPLNKCEDLLHDFWLSKEIFKELNITQFSYGKCPYFRCRYCCGLLMNNLNLRPCPAHDHKENTVLKYRDCAKEHNPPSSVTANKYLENFIKHITIRNTHTKIKAKCKTNTKAKCITSTKQAPKDKEKIKKPDCTDCRQNIPRATPFYCTFCNRYWHPNCYKKKDKDPPLAPQLDQSTDIPFTHTPLSQPCYLCQLDINLTPATDYNPQCSSSSHSSSSSSTLSTRPDIIHFTRHTSIDKTCTDDDPMGLKGEALNMGGSFISVSILSTSDKIDKYENLDWRRVNDAYIPSSSIPPPSPPLLNCDVFTGTTHDERDGTESILEGTSPLQRFLFLLIDV